MKHRTLALLFIAVFFLHYTLYPWKGVAIAAHQASAVSLQAPRWIPSKPTAIYGELIVTQWFPVPNAASYRIYINDKLVATTDVTAHTMKLPPNVEEVRIQISALSRTGEEGPLSSINILHVKGVPVPANVTTTTNIDKGTITINWDPPEGAVLFKIYRSVTEEGPYELLDAVANLKAYVDSSVSPGTGYWYAVSAQGMSMKESGISVKVHGFLDYPLERPSLMEGYPKLLDPETVVLKWEPVPGAIRYRVQCIFDPVSNYSEYKLVSEETEATTYQFQVGIPDKDYTISMRVSAIYRGATGPVLETKQLAYKPLPLNVNANHQEGTVDLSWNYLEGGDSDFVVYRCRNFRVYNKSGEQLFDWEQIASSLTSNTFSDGTAKIGEEYFYKVYALDSSGAVSHSSSVLAGVRYHALPPRELSVQVSYDVEAVDIRWALMPGATGYIPYRSDSPTGHLKPLRFKPTMKNKGYYRDTRVTLGSEYWYAVKAIYGDGITESPLSQRVRASLPDELFRKLPLNATTGLLDDPIKPKGIFLWGRNAPISVMYDLTWTGPTEISVVFSEDGGKTFSLIPEPGSLTGDVGKDVLPGVDRRITWDWRNQLEELPPQGKLRSRIFRVNVDGPKESWEALHSLEARAREFEDELKKLELSHDQGESAGTEYFKLLKKRKIKLTTLLSELESRIILVPGWGRSVHYDNKHQRLSLEIKAGEHKEECFIKINRDLAKPLLDNRGYFEINAGIAVRKGRLSLRGAWVPVESGRYWASGSESKFTAITVGSTHNLALKEDGSVWTFGEQLADRGRFSRAVPVKIAEVSNICAISAGDQESYALRNDGTVWAWGANGKGQLGDGKQTKFSHPVQVKNLSEIVAIAAGKQYGPTLALKRDGTVWQWGYGMTTPTQIESLSPVAAMTIGIRKAYAQREDGAVWQWGYGKTTPTQIEGLSPVAAITVGIGKAYVLRENGTVWQWETYANSRSRGEKVNERPHAEPIMMLSNIKAISAGSAHTVALKDDGSVWVWGSNSSGQLGNSQMKSQDIPYQIVGVPVIKAVAAGDRSTIALAEDGTVWTWGGHWTKKNAESNEKEKDPNYPRKLENLSEITAISSGHSNFLALRDDGTLWFWDFNSSPVWVEGGY